MDKKLQKNISYILQFINSARFKASSLPNLVIIDLKDFIKLNVNWNMIVKNVKLVELNITIATVFSNIQTLKMI